MSAWLKLAGLVLLVLAGGGGGAAIYLQKRAQWQAAHTFARLVAYLLDGIRYRAMPCIELLEQAAGREEFRPLGLEGCRSFEMVPIPPTLRKTVGGELREGFAALSMATQESACGTLSYMLRLCEAAVDEKKQDAEQARRLYPKLGGCLGLAAAIVLL